MISIINGLVIDPANGIEGEYDILVEAGKISEIGPRGTIPTNGEVIDATGKWVTPGLIDIHVHLREPGFEWKETIAAGTKAAVLGGFTSVCPMPNTNPVNDNAQVTEFMFEKAREAGLANIFPIGAVTKNIAGKQMAPLSELKHAGCIAFSDDGEPVYNAGIMRKALEWCRMYDATICCHEEEKTLSVGAAMNESALALKLGLGGMPGVAEDVMVARDIELARFTGGRAHICHISTARGVELVRRAKNDGIRITCEVTPHHLHLTEDAVGDYDTNAKMSPPLREMHDVEGLRQGIKDGTVDAVASDHAPHHADSKCVEFANAAWGILGLQTNLPLLLDFVRDETISRSRAIELFSAGPARALNMDRGTLSKGAAADIAVIDPEQSWNLTEDKIASVSRNTPFLGRELTGRATDVVVGGRIVVKDCEVI